MISFRHTRPFFYVHIPKTAGHTIDRFFLERDLVDIKTWHHTADQQLSLLAHPERFWSFATIRNPWDRMVSAYFWQMPGSQPDIPTPWGRLDLSFRDYCYSDFSWYPDDQKFHLLPQSNYIFGSRDEQLVNFTARFESLNEQEWPIVCAYLGIPHEPLPRRNVTSHVPYWHYYTPDLVEHVGKMFERDVRLLGYTFPMEKLSEKG